MYCDWFQISKLMRNQEHLHLFHTVVTGTHSSTFCFYVNFTSVVVFILPQQASQFEAHGSERPPRHWPHWHNILYILCGWLVVLHVGQTPPSESVKTALVQNKLQLLLSTKIFLVSELVLY